MKSVPQALPVMLPAPSARPLVIPVFISHRGCPHQCLFCNQEKISGCTEEQGRQVDVAGIIREWLDRETAGSRNRARQREVQVAFYGGSFTCLPFSVQEGLLEQVRPFLDNGSVDTIRLSTRPDCICDEIIKLLRSYRVKIVELGVQSMSDAVLSANRRGHTAADSRNATEMLKRAGITPGIQLMVGLPNETTSSFLRGVKEVCTMRPELVRLYPALVLQGAELAHRYQSGGYTPLRLSKAVALTAAALQLFNAAGIRVVRTGLQPSLSLERALVAGPFHPAFGELVQSHIWFKTLRKKLRGLRPDEFLEARVSHRDCSAVIGRKRANIQRLESLGYQGRFRVVGDRELEQGSIYYVVS